MGGPFFLTGDLNGWHPASPAHRFEEVVLPYGRDEWGREHPRRQLRTGAFHLTVDLPAGRHRFKLLEGGGWERQWSTQRFHDQEQPFEAHRFRSGCGLEAGVLVPRGSGTPPHVELTWPGGPARFDFHPAARTLSVHGELHRAPGPRLEPWRELSCADAVYSTWIALPWGYSPELEFRYPLLLAFDGRSQLYGEDPRQGRFGVEGRQLWRALDVLARQGVIPPTVLVGVEVPRVPARADGRERLGEHDRHAAFVDEGGACHRAYRASIARELVPALCDALPLERDPARHLLLGHSWGADFALRLLASEPERFGGAIALSPSAPLERLDALPAGGAQRVVVSYAQHDLGPFFLTEGAASGRALAAKGLAHLVQLCPDATHDPASLERYLPAALAFALG